MRRNRILQLLKENKGVGSFAIKAEADRADVYLYDMIVDTDVDAEWYGGVSAESFVQQLAALDVAQIDLHVNSPGGSVFAGRAMENALRQSKAKVIAHVEGLAASAASVVIMGADEIRMAPGAFLMIHKAWSIAMGNADDFRQEAGVLDQIDTSLAATYAQRTGASVEDITAMMAAETWIVAADAVAQKFADAVEEGEQPKALAWNLSAFLNAPKPAPKAKPANSTAILNVHVTVDPPQPDRAALKRAALLRLIPA